MTIDTYPIGGDEYVPAIQLTREQLLALGADMRQNAERERAHLEEDGADWWVELVS